MKQQAWSIIIASVCVLWMVSVRSRQRWGTRLTLASKMIAKRSSSQPQCTQGQTQQQRGAEKSSIMKRGILFDGQDDEVQLDSPLLSPTRSLWPRLCPRGHPTYYTSVGISALTTQRALEMSLLQVLEMSQDFARCERVIYRSVYKS